MTAFWRSKTLTGVGVYTHRRRRHLWANSPTLRPWALCSVRCNLPPPFSVKRFTFVGKFAHKCLVCECHAMCDADLPLPCSIISSGRFLDCKVMWALGRGGRKVRLIYLPIPIRSSDCIGRYNRMMSSSDFLYRAIVSLYLIFFLKNCVSVSL